MHVMPEDWRHRRFPATALNGIVATSQPQATQAALRILKRGGNAADAAIAAAAVLCVLEPMWTGIGGDCFAIVWNGKEAVGLDAAGPAPRNVKDAHHVDERGPRSVTVPGAVAGWNALLERYGTLGLDACLTDAIDLAVQGYALPYIVARHWHKHVAPEEYTPPPAPGARIRLPELAESLRWIAQDGPAALYEGKIAEAIAAASWLEVEDLAAYQPKWVRPLAIDYNGFKILEMPPPTQGVVVLESLELLKGGDFGIAAQANAVKAALKDAHDHVRDGADVSHLLDADYIARRRKEATGAVAEPPGATVYLAIVDENGLAVSFIQSLYMPFGSRVFAKGTGILLQNRGGCFSVEGRVRPGVRPYHTTIPAMLLEGGAFYGAFGVVGGFIQAQAHVQLLRAHIHEGLDPQLSLDRPRFFIDGNLIRLERGLWHEEENLRRQGFQVELQEDHLMFGGGQMIVRSKTGWLGASDSRKDGYAEGF